MNAYGDDLAYIHDVGHGDFARQAAPALLELFRRRGLSSGLVVDLGCGSGVWAEELVRAGYAVLGIDVSPAMIALARRRVPAAAFRCQSFLEARLPPCVAVTSVGECLNYLFDTNNNADTLSGLFARVHDALQPGGLLVFDVLEPGRPRGPNPQKRFREGDDWAVLVELEEDRKQNRLTRRITSFRQVGKLFRRDREVHHVQLYRGAELAAALRRAGFRVSRLRGYGALRFSPGHVGLLASKPPGPGHDSRTGR